MQKVVRFEFEGKQYFTVTDDLQPELFLLPDWRVIALTWTDSLTPRVLYRSYLFTISNPNMGNLEDTARVMKWHLAEGDEPCQTA